MIRYTLFLWMMAGLLCTASAQTPLTVLVSDSLTGERLSGVSVRVTGTPLGGHTDSAGRVMLNNLPEGRQEITVTLLGYEKKSVLARIPADTQVVIRMTPAGEELEELIVASTRTNARMEDTPIRVEVLGTEEMDEENSIKPGNITSLLGDISGIQIQQSSAISGNSNLRIQGLDGKYTQVLRDGLPLYEGFSGNFGILQVPPLDLKQLEIIKGSSSTLYGEGAIGGIINLVSKEPSEKNEGSITLNQSTLTERNFNGYCSVKKHNRGATLFSGVTYQNPVDVNKDGFSDVPKIQSLLVHPRLFFFPGPNTRLALGFSSGYEIRRGGDMMVLDDRGDSLHTLFEENKSDRNTGDLIFTHRLPGKQVLTIRGCASFFNRTLTTDQYRFYGSQVNSFSEITYFIPSGMYDFVAGANFRTKQFEKNNKEFSLINDFSNYSAGAFLQNTWKRKEKTYYEAGIRSDYHSEFGWFILPRAALLHKFNETWYTRMGLGLGYLTPDPLAESNTERDIRKILPIPDSLKAEQSASANMEINYKTRLGEESFLYFNHAFFFTQIQDPVMANTDSLGITSFSNHPVPAYSWGWDAYLRMTFDELEIYFGYTYTMASHDKDSAHRYITYTPRNRAATIVSYEVEGKWRFALEGSYTGFQYREDGSKTPDYLFTAAMIEKKFRNASLVLNCENVLDERQTRHEAIVQNGPDGPSFIPLWGPIDGRVINLSLVLRF